MTTPRPEYAATRKQWIALIQELLAARDDSIQDELFRDAEILFAHMMRQKWETE